MKTIELDYDVGDLVYVIGGTRSTERFRFHVVGPLAVRQIRIIQRRGGRRVLYSVGDLCYHYAELWSSRAAAQVHVDKRNK